MNKPRKKKPKTCYNFWVTNLLGILAADLPEDGISPAIGTAQPFESFFKQKAHDFRRLPISVIKIKLESNRKHKYSQPEKSNLRGQCRRPYISGDSESSRLTSTARSSPRLLRPQSTAALPLRIQTPGRQSQSQSPASHEYDREWKRDGVKPLERERERERNRTPQSRTYTIPQASSL